MIEPPCPLRLQDAGPVLDPEEDAADEDRERVVPVLDRLVGDRPEGARHAGVVVASFRSAITTRAPSSRKRSAVSRPMPLPPPVMTATLPSSRPAIASPPLLHDALAAERRDAVRVEAEPAQHGVGMGADGGGGRADR